MAVALRTLKKALSTPPTLELPYFHRPFEDGNDAFSTAVAAVLMENKVDGKVNQINLASRKMISAELNYPPAKTFKNKY